MPSNQSNSYRCPICGRSIAWSHFKRHLWMHERRGFYTRAPWLRFLDDTGWPRGKADR